MSYSIVKCPYNPDKHWFLLGPRSYQEFYAREPGSRKVDQLLCQGSISQEEARALHEQIKDSPLPERRGDRKSCLKAHRAERRADMEYLRSTPEEQFDPLASMLGIPPVQHRRLDPPNTSSY